MNKFQRLRQHADDGGARRTDCAADRLQLDPILARLHPAAKLRDFIDRIKRDVDAQRADARASGLLDIDSLLAPATTR